MATPAVPSLLLRRLSSSTNDLLRTFHEAGAKSPGLDQHGDTLDVTDNNGKKARTTTLDEIFAAKRREDDERRREEKRKGKQTQPTKKERHDWEWFKRGDKKRKTRFAV